ncbi:hypothetical protein GCM10011316_13240 [Roseibium aquae]|uniref:LysM domain-containing protein n=1 Tax=Roseibium aquae TaxID=1323746 RepID=A0A916TEV8_9HYPH|nr:LysM peptidoglycan-binding domain-containing protein [Roseibium aquae]GGB42692.1 hypothetical protein GCM10011316_13240 [Roseibium aquae]
MTRQAVIWSLLVAGVVGVVAIGVGTVYRSAPEETDVAVQTGGNAEGGGDAAPGASVSAESAQTGGGDTPEVDATTAGGPEAQDTATAETGSSGAITPSFDVVGVEPTGDAVIAGRSESGSIVALTANGRTVGKGIADQNGEWTIILDTPLDPGDYDVGLEVQDEAGAVKTRSEQRLTVSIPENRMDRPLVVLNTPDAPSDILQMPSAPVVADAAPEAEGAAGGATPEAMGEVAALAPEAGAPDISAGQSADAVPAASDTAAGEEPAPATVAEVAAAEAGESPDTSAAPQVSASTGDETETAVAAAPPGTEQGAESAGTPAGEELAAAVEPAVENLADGLAGSQSVETAVAQTDPDPAPSQAVVAEAAQPVAEPVTAPEAEAKAEAGTGTRTADADKEQASPGVDGGVTVAVAPEAAGVAGTDAADASDQAPEAQAQTSAAGGESQESQPTVTVDAVESEEGKVFVAGTGEPGTEVRVYVDESFAGNAPVNEAGRWLVEGDRDIPAGDVEVRADLVESGTDQVEARAAVTFEKVEPEQIVLTRAVASGTQTADGTQAVEVVKPVPNVIIRKGDNLWRISRRLYGQGIRYTTIYQANQDQIRDPDLIYPGQVFLTPQGDLNWSDNGPQGPTAVQ